VLDAYTRQDVLADLYGFDNAPFIDRLRRMKFAVADRATTPFNQTMLVMTSMFSASYLDDSVPPGSRTSLRRVMRTELHHNPVMETLSRLGYRTAALDVRYDPVRMGQVDRLLGSYRVSNFEMKIFEQTVLHSIARRLGLLGPSVTRDFFDTPYERDLTGPFFLYVHALAPHPPFDIDRHGNEIEPVGGWRGLSDGSHFTQYDPERRRMYRDGYVEKLRFTNDQVLSYLSRIMNDIPDPKIIILHGDHGGGILYDQDSADNTCAIERFSPLLAVYSSDGRLQPALAPDTNLVNLYRLVFNTYFNSDLPLLPNRSTYADWLEPTKQQTLAPDQLSRTCHQTDIVSELHQTPAVPFRDD
jgi:hypothetical protein